MLTTTCRFIRTPRRSYVHPRDAHGILFRIHRFGRLADRREMLTVDLYGWAIRSLKGVLPTEKITKVEPRRHG